MRPKTTMFAVIVLGTFTVGSPARAATLHVPADYPTIQSCIDAAVSGQDECVVAPGTYHELINFLGKAITVRSSDGPEVTIIDGTGMNGSVVTCASGETSATVLSGFTITGGTGTVKGKGYFYTLGGGLYIVDASPTILNNSITRNNVQKSYDCDGGGIYLRNSTAIIANNSISINSGIRGSGILGEYSEAKILGCTVTGNKGGLGAIHFEGTTEVPTIANTIVAFNASGTGIFASQSADTNFRNNCFHGNGSSELVGIVEDIIGQHGNIAADPRLVGLQYPNTHLQPDSPCINAGSSGDAYGDFDIDNQTRIRGESVDIGADESDGTLWSPGPFITVHVSPSGDDSNDGFSWDMAKRTVQAGINLASEENGNVWVQAGTYLESITLLPYCNLYGGFAGNETAFGQRDWVAHPTTLDGQGGYQPVIQIFAGEMRSRIDGFVITNWSEPENFVYGGIVATNSSPIIENNLIQGLPYTSSAGRAISLSESSAQIYHNRIVNLQSVFDGGSPTIVGNTLGGLKGTYSRNVEIANNDFNGASSGIRLDNCDATIEENRFTGTGTAIEARLSLPDVPWSPAWNSSSIVIRNNILVGNGSGVEIHNGNYLGEIVAHIKKNILVANGVGILIDSTVLTDYHRHDTLGDIESNIIAAGGSGVKVNYATADIRFNTIVGNTCTNRCSGVYGYNADIELYNNILAHNYLGLACATSCSSNHWSIWYNNLSNAGNYFFVPTPPGSNGNIELNPMFIRLPDPGEDGWGDDPSTTKVDESENDDYGDLRLLPGSPCINAGDPDFVPQAGETDLDGHARVLCGRVDMGAYEVGIGDYDCDQSVNLVDLSGWPACATDPLGTMVHQDAPYSSDAVRSSARFGAGLAGRNATTGSASLHPWQHTLAPAGATGCEAFDFDADGDVDLKDFAAWQNLLGK